MKTIYLDSDYMCHLEDDGTRTEVQTDLFDGVIDAAIPFYRFIPQGHEWTNPNTGATLKGLFVQSTDDKAIDNAISEAFIADMQNALALLGVTNE